MKDIHQADIAADEEFSAWLNQPEQLRSTIEATLERIGQQVRLLAGDGDLVDVFAQWCSPGTECSLDDLGELTKISIRQDIEMVISCALKLRAQK